jgi:hypothetical protein
VNYVQENDRNPQGKGSSQNNSEDRRRKLQELTQAYMQGKITHQDYMGVILNWQNVPLEN